MKVSETSKLIERYTGLLETAGSPLAKDIARLKDGFKGWSNKKMTDYIKAAKQGLEIVHTSQVKLGKSCTIHEMLRQLNALMSFAAPVTKKALVQDLNSYIQLFEAATDSDTVASFVERLGQALKLNRQDIIDHFSRLLKEAIGDESEFEAAYALLKSSGFKKDELVAVARKVYGHIPTSTTAANALRLIREPHDARMSARRGNKAMRGRSAA